jgi:outer membrane protein TolC
MAALTARAATSAAFYRALHAERSRDVAREAEQLADDLGTAAQARFEAGETAILDVNLAHVEQARARRERLSAEGLLERAYGELREILALPPESTVGVVGDWTGVAPPSLAALLLRVAERPDVRSLTAGVTEADADWRLTRAMRRPDLIAGVGLRREAGEPIAGLTSDSPFHCSSVMSVSWPLQPLGSKPPVCHSTRGVARLKRAFAARTRSTWWRSKR